MTISARRFKKILEQHGHEVRVLTCAKPEQVKEQSEAYLLKRQPIPVFDKLITAQGMQFGKVDDSIIGEAVTWAQLVHILSPFGMWEWAMNHPSAQIPIEPSSGAEAAPQAGT